VASQPSMLSPSSPEHDLGVVGILVQKAHVRPHRTTQTSASNDRLPNQTEVAPSLSNGRSVGSFAEQWQLH
jgi:hypothetical protein